MLKKSFSFILILVVFGLFTLIMISCQPVLTGVTFKYTGADDSSLVLYRVDYTTDETNFVNIVKNITINPDQTKSYNVPAGTYKLRIQGEITGSVTFEFSCYIHKDDSHIVVNEGKFTSVPLDENKITVNFKETAGCPTVGK